MFFSSVPLKYLVASWMAALVPSAPWSDTFEDTAEAIADAAESRPFLGTPERTAALLTAWAFHESTFKPAAHGDGGRSIGLFQIQPRTLGISDAWLLEDPGFASRTAARLLATSARLCKAMATNDQYSWYASGKCNAAGARASRIRVSTAAHLK